eukprot:TRINITY_DN18631_c0_g2_i6.p1 TRINITY_DN18631_c0_g2~~TRINITY_DN18631_c0_g2_i6.p1  ORF type:complete len:324 (+),score=52.33 TRINITY_DN18631_c0_g2_i6:65-1036(+)
MIIFFFFQAEDGIRDAQESRGLGDVYKRQEYGEPVPSAMRCVLSVTSRSVATALRLQSRGIHSYPARLGDRVLVAYRAALSGHGEAKVDAGSESQIEFVIGEGQMVPGFEHGIAGLEVGESTELVVLPSDGYGEWSEEHLVKIPRSELPSGVSPGSRLRLDSRGQIGIVREMDDSKALLDLNHELAGKTVVFYVTLLECKPVGAHEVSILSETKQGDAMTFPMPGDSVVVHYVGRSVKTNQVFDSSEQRNKPLSFTVGQNNVIAGFEEGVKKMSQGQRVLLSIPANSQATGGKFEFKPPFPPEGDLVFEFELVSVFRSDDNLA